MRKQVFGRQLKRDKNERAALFKSLMSSLVLAERIQTTEAKAKSIKSTIEKLVTKVKKSGHIKNYHLDFYLSASAIPKFVQDIAPRFAQRPGGYTRIIRVGNRFSDNAPLVLMEWVDGKKEEKVVNKKIKTAKKKSEK